jgi:hypothetical protein
VIEPAPTPRVREKARRMHRRSLIAFIFSAISPNPATVAGTLGRRFARPNFASGSCGRASSRRRQSGVRRGGHASPASTPGKLTRHQQQSQHDGVIALVWKPSREYLEKRWAEGCHDASRLCRELQQKGYTGQCSRVTEFLQPWRSQEPKRNRHHRKLPGLRLVAFWLAKPAEKRKPAEQQWVQSITKGCPEIATAERLAQGFRDLVQNHKASELDTWLESAGGIKEFRGFAAGIRRDHASVIAGLEQSWSNAQVEGQVHRLKLLERQM